MPTSLPFRVHLASRLLLPMIGGVIVDGSANTGGADFDQ